MDPKKIRSRKIMHPRFARPNVGRTDRKRLKDVWRRPRGIDNKQRAKRVSAGFHPNVGYMNPKNIRGLHPCGRREFLVCNVGQLEALAGYKDSIAVRISSKVGRRMRSQITNRASELGLKVLN
ncbi:MAG: eL32 family ribosomal protein [Candidatus Micrarchaeia archaeon]